MLALGLALSASLSWGIADFIGGLQARRLELLRVLLLSQGFAFVILAVVVIVSGERAPSLTKLLPAAAAGVGGMAGLTAFYRALAIGTMSIVAPIAATGVCIPVVVGIAGGEHPAVTQLAGILAACAGVVLVSRDPDHDAGSPAGRAARVSVALAILAALGFGSFAVGLRSSARADVLWALVAARGTGISAVLIAFIVRRAIASGHARTWEGALGVPPSHYLPLAAMGILDLGANGLYALATRHGLLSIVAVAASLYPLVTVLLARVLLGERVRRSQEVGLAAAVAGIVLIAAG